VNLIWRTILHFFFASRAPISSPFDVVSSAFRVLPTDLDVNGHMNNGRYLSISDLGRFDLLSRGGMWRELMRRGWYPVIASSTISYRKSLNPWQRFELESRFLGHDERNVFIEQRFVVAGEVYARLFVRGRFLKKSGGHVPMDELVELFGVPPHTVAVPDWVLHWGTESALPSTKQPAPSEWD
jgi:acyl-CoA thioesterase FadM